MMQHTSGDSVDGGSMGDDELSIKQQQGDVGGDDLGAFPHNEECTAILTMKCGEPLMAVRKKLHEEIPITFVPEEGFGVFQSKIERHYSKIGPGFVQETRGIYLKPSSNATQSKYVLLTKENFDPLLRMRWKVARSMKVDLKYEVFSYFVDTANKKEKKRMSMKMFQPTSNQRSPDGNSSTVAATTTGYSESGNTPATPGTFLGFGGPNTVVAGMAQPFPLHSPPQSIASNYQQHIQVDTVNAASTSGGSRKSSRSALNNNGPSRDSTANERPRKMARGSMNRTSAGGSQDQGSNANSMVSEHLDMSHDGPVFRSIPFRINGFVVPLEVDVTALQRCLGLLPTSSNSALGEQQSSSSADAQQP